MQGSPAAAIKDAFMEVLRSGTKLSILKMHLFIITHENYRPSDRLIDVSMIV
jgi:hypothetical protein